jgi:hypothetical protein
MGGVVCNRVFQNRRLQISAPKKKTIRLPVDINQIVKQASSVLKAFGY